MSTLKRVREWIIWTNQDHQLFNRYSLVFRRVNMNDRWFSALVRVTRHFHEGFCLQNSHFPLSRSWCKKWFRTVDGNQNSCKLTSSERRLVVYPIISRVWWHHPSWVQPTLIGMLISYISYSRFQNFRFKKNKNTALTSIHSFSHFWVSHENMSVNTR